MKKNKQTKTKQSYLLSTILRPEAALCSLVVFIADVCPDLMKPAARVDPSWMQGIQVGGVEGESAYCIASEVQQKNQESTSHR